VGDVLSNRTFGRRKAFFFEKKAKNRAHRFAPVPGTSPGKELDGSEHLPFFFFLLA
jgi:hypothetical protein